VDDLATLIERFDRDWSRFRDDSLVTRISKQGGTYRLPATAAPLLETYRALYEATDGRVSPLVGRALENLGYDSAYSLRDTGLRAATPTWDDALAWDGETLTALNPVLLDVGAAGKGYLVDIVGRLLVAAGIDGFVIDASGDILHAGDRPIRVALEHPRDATKAVGVVDLMGASLCASASNRRSWGEGLHHIIDATTGLPADHVIATWAIAATALEADGLATALFLADPARLARDFDFDYVRMFANGRIERSTHLDGELFV